ncbi:hypothetical protein PHMEG_0005899 [Phytophthora megakarya]|uniref:Uncharacterized protein n=1 Tax=Phytophthora megakarya TaxID=4795 RepID=A0A225WQ90_9STRA|nr:hypothetical protein PHMEG_0005899 [Phytophthora megakarya]
MGGRSPFLTTHGVRQLSRDLTDAAIRVQVLGIYRYLADPALRQRLGRPFEDARDVFDVLLSDGRHKLKAVLDPTLHKLVWTRELRARCIVRLQFLCSSHPREVELIPLVGERMYYLPLRSDHFTLDWASTFTGMPDEDSPLDELQSNWSVDEDNSNDNQEDISTSVDWNMDPEVSTDLFTPDFKKLHTILEALKMIKENQDGSTSKQNPPMLGAIRVKSKVINLGDPDRANPFPFMFNAVVGMLFVSQ